MLKLTFGVFILAVTIALLSSGAVVIGHIVPIPRHISLLHLNDCEIPCWIGIIPNKTTGTEAKSRLYEIYTQEPDVFVSENELEDNFIISSKSQGELFKISFLISYLGEDEPIQQLIIEFDGKNAYHLNEIYQYLTPISYVDISGNWMLHSPAWSLQGVGIGYKCDDNMGIKSNDFASRLTLGDIYNEVDLAQFGNKWHGFRSCYGRSR